MNHEVYKMEMQKIKSQTKVKEKEFLNLKKIIENLEDEKTNLDNIIKENFKDRIIKLSLKKDKSIQTSIENVTQMYSTDYMVIYKIFGTVNAIWQIFHDSIARYNQYNLMLNNYEIKIEKNLIEEESLIIELSLNLLDNKNQKDLKVAIGNEVLKKLKNEEKYKEIFNKIKQELRHLKESESFCMEMNSLKNEIMFNRQNIDFYTLDIFYKKFKIKKYLKKKKKNKLILDILNKKILVTRRHIWNKVIGNKLKISPELYYSLLNLQKIGFPQDVLKTIENDLKRVLKFYRKDILNSKKSLLVEKININNITKKIENDFNKELVGLKIFKDIKEILMCFQIYRGDIGYVQSMSRIVYLLYIIHKNNIETFISFCNMILLKKPLLSFFRFNVGLIDKFAIDLKKDLEIICPKFLKEICDNNPYVIDLFVTEAFFTIFSSYFNEIDCLKVFDCFFCFGEVVFMFISMCIFQLFSLSGIKFNSFNEVKIFTQNLGFSKIIEDGRINGININYNKVKLKIKKLYENN